MAEIIIKTEEEIKLMREAGKLAARILKMVGESAKAGVSTKELDNLAAREISRAGAKASFLGHAGYPASICTSVNNAVVHGIPSEQELRDGDIVGIDLGVYFKGYHADTAITIPVGEISSEKKKLIIITKRSLDEAIALIKPGKQLGDIQAAIQKTIEDAGFGVIRDLTGHGIGKDLQEFPPIPNYGKSGTGPILKEGMVLAIEPMVSEGDWHVKILKDGWTVVTADGLPSAHFEHTIAIRKEGAEILTK